MATRRRRAITRSQAKAQGLTRYQTNQGNIGTAKRPISSKVYFKENAAFNEFHAGVQRPKWLTPKKPTWAQYLGKTVKYGGIAGLVGGSIYQLYDDYTRLKQIKRQKPLPGYLDKVYPKTTTTTFSTTMAPLRQTKRIATRRAYRLKRRYRKMARHTPKRRYTRKRRFNKRKGGDLFLRNLRKAKRLRLYMKPWRMTNTYRRGCDFINLGHIECPTDMVSGNAPLAQYHTLEFNPTMLPNLQAILGNEFGKFKEYRIDRITYKVICINARRLAMEPNYVPPDGTGVTGENHMAHPEEYAKKNSYVFHYRQENDDINTGEFNDWSKFQFAKPGTLQYITFFRQKGKMFKCPVTTTIRSQIGTGTSTASDFLNRDLHGARLGWIDKDLANQNKINIGKAGIIVPGVRSMGWDSSIANPKPKLEVSVRICWSARECGFSTDQI